MSRTIRVGLLGAGFIGQMHSLAMLNMQALHLEPQIKAELVAIADQNPVQAEKVGAQYGYQTVYDNWEDLVKRDDIELFVNATPNFSHYEPTIAAAQSGKHVYCEKPLAKNADEAYRIWKDVEKTGVINMAAFMWRAIPAIRYIKDMVAAGELGEIRNYHSTFMLNMLEEDGRLSWRFSKDIAGSGALGDLGSHHIDVCRYICGEIETVSGLTRTWSKDSAGKITDVNDDSVVSIAELACGGLAVFEASRVATGHGVTGRIEVQGTKGGVRFYMERLNELDIMEPGLGRRTVMINKPGEPFADYWLPVGVQGAHPHGWNGCFAHQDSRIFQAIAGQCEIRPYAADFEDGYRIAQIVDTIALAAQTGRRETVQYRK